jgi:hypothetical protein
VSFLNPLLLFGGLAIAAPIIIHLFMNRRVKPVVWAAMRFLQVSVQKRQKRMNVEDLLLLLLRCLFLVFLALALARPVLGGHGSAGLTHGSETAVIVLDNSYSMGAEEGGVSRFDEARKAAGEIVDNLGSGSSVAVFLFSDVVRAVIPEPTFDLNLARKVIGDATLSDRTTDVQPVLAEALEMLRQQRGGQRNIYLITDGQASGWKSFDDIRKMTTDPAARTHVILVGGSGKPLRNLCVSDLRLESAIAAVGEPARFSVAVTNFDSAEARNVAVRLLIDKEAASDEGVIESIAPGVAKRISLYSKFRDPGYHTVTGQINGDALAADNQRVLALRAADDLRVLLVDGDPGAEPRDAGTFYLRNALVPVPEAQRESYFIKTKTIAPAALDATKLSDYEAIVFVDVPSLSQSGADAIAGYLERGGGLIIFPGAKTDTSFYNDTFGKRLHLMPGTFGALRGKPDDKDTFFTLQDKDYKNRIVNLWNDSAAGSLALAHFNRAYTLTLEKGHPGQAGEPDVVVKYADGSPAVLERSWGRGKVILFSSTANAEWNDLPLHPVFVPLIARTFGEILAGQDARLNLPVGGRFEFVCPADWVGRDAIITAPGAKEDAGELRRVEVVNNLPLLRFDETDRAGGYSVALKTDPPAVLKFAVQSNPEESNLEIVSSRQLDSLAPAAQVVRWTPGAAMGGMLAGGGGGGGTELWFWLATLALITACAELALAGIFSAAK